MKTASYMDKPVKREWKQDCTHVHHNQLDPLPFKTKYTNIVLYFVVAQTLCNYKTSTILVYIMLNSEGV